MEKVKYTKILYTVIILTMFKFPINSAKGACPSVCSCKWKGGKQTVECVNRALITIPEFVDSETQVLDMTNNNLQILPGEIFQRSGLLNLQKVYLRQCQLGQIDDQAFKGLKNLVELDLSYNLLTSIPSATFLNVPLLRDLILAYNPISKIEGYSFKNIPGLVKLDLSHCDLQTIAPKAFEGLDFLQSLKLNGNKLTELKPRTVETLRKLHGVDLHDNPWVCDCRLRAAKLWLIDNNIPFTFSPICSGGPERVKHKTFSELHVDDFACKPEILPVSRYIESTVGENSSILCRAGAVPISTVKWYWNGKQLINNTAFNSFQRIFIFEERRESAFEKRSTLVLTNSQETDSSEFYCVAENRAGSAEANFTLHVSLRVAGMASFSGGKIVGLSCALIILMLTILLLILVFFVRVRRLPMTETKTPSRIEVVTVVNRNNILSQKSNLASSNSFESPQEQKTPHDNNLIPTSCNPVQKPPRLNELSNFDTNSNVTNNSSIVSPSGNNPDLINDTKRLEGDDTIEVNNTISDIIERPDSGEYRNVCESLYPSGLWENSPQQLESNCATDNYLRRLALPNTLNTTATYTNYNDKTPIMEEESMYLGQIDEESDFRTASFYDNRNLTNENSNNNLISGYPADYGLPIVPGAGDPNGPVPMIPPQSMLPTNAKTLRVWQKGGVPVLPPVSAIKRALTHNRNSPDEGYQEGYGTDV